MTGVPTRGRGVLTGLLVALVLSLVAPVASEAGWVKSVEFVQIVLSPSGGTSLVNSANLTKGQTAANCVPFVTAMADSGANGFGLAYPDVFLTAGSPATVSAQRTVAGGTVTVGVYVVEFDPTYVRVQQGTFAFAAGNLGPVMPTLSTNVDLARAALVFYSRNSFTNNKNGYADVMIEGSIASTLLLNFARNDNQPSVDGHWYVFEALNVSGSYAFAVQTKAFTFSTASGNSTALAPSVPSAQTMVVGSYRTAQANDHSDVGSYRLFLAGCAGSPSMCTTVTAESYAGATAANVTAFVVTFSGAVRVRRGSLNYGAAATQATFSPLSPNVDITDTMVWNGFGGVAGIMRANEGSGDQMFAAQQKLILANSTTVEGDRAATASAAAVGTWEVVEFNPTAMYYSVGTQAASLYSNNASAASGTLTLAVAAASNVGVGDEVRVGASRYYITRRQSSTQFTIQNSAANLGTPGDTNITFASQAITIFRAFNSLTAAEANSSNASHLNTSDLVAGNFQLNWPCYKDGLMNDQVTISGYTTGIFNYIRAYTPVFSSQVGTSQRHTGTARTGFRLRPTSAVDNDTIIVMDNFVRIEGLEIDGSASTAPNGAGGVDIETGATTPVGHYVSHNIIYENNQYTAIYVNATSARVWDNMVFRANNGSLGAVVMDQAAGTAWFYNNTVFDHNGPGIHNMAGTLIATNNVSMKFGVSVDFSGTITQSRNVSSDGTAVCGGCQVNKNLYVNYFVNTTLGTENLHLKADSNALWGSYGADLDSDPNLPVVNDIDLQTRDASLPDIGADEYLGATAVKLASFTARGFDRAVSLDWATASELDNVGFHVYRGASGNGPWQRLTASLVPGLGSSPEGKAYRFLDSGLTNGTMYYYRLEDVDRSGVVTSHGPVSAVPVAGQALPVEPEAPSGPPEPTTKSSAPWQAHGSPADVSLRVLQRTARGVTLELRTGGFYSQVLADGSVRLYVPGFFDTKEPGLPSVPVKRAWIDAMVGRGARIVSVRAGDLRSFPGVSLANAGAPQAQARTDGTYRASFRVVRSQDPGGLFPRVAARVLDTAFQDEVKRAYLELAPLRIDGPRRRLVLAGRLVVTIVFDTQVAGERTTGGSRGRREPAPRGKQEAPTAGAGTLVARLAARAAGVHAVSWESLAGSPALQQRGGQALPSTSLRLSRLGQSVAFHVEPRADRFGPGSILYFVADGPETAYGTETVYELAVTTGGVQMAVEASSRKAGTTLVPALFETRSFEQNTNYLPGLLNTARDSWFWDIGLLAPNGRDYPFTLSAPSAASGPAVLAVDLQGGSDAQKLDPDHDVRVLVNGVPVGEARWDGLNPAHFEASVDASVLVDGANTLRIEDLDTTGANDSVVYLDRFSIQYARKLVADGGRLEGRAPVSGLVRASGFPTGALLLDVSGKTPAWLTASASGGEIAFPAEAQKRYLAVSPDAVLHPEVRPVTSAATLRSTSLQADWIVIAPQELLPAAEPLLAQRESQGLEAMAVPLEQIQDEFGYGERSPQMIRDFLAWAYHHWKAPSLRYVLLLGDASYDPKGYIKTATRKDLLPSPLVKSTFLWTVSDPSLAAVNGDDAIPDLAIGRLTAGTLAEAEAAVAKILAFEESGQSLDGNAVLVADNPDLAGNFEANANDIASLLPDRPVERIFLTQYGAGTRAAVLNAFNAGASLVSYVGHGSQALWASEGVLRSIDIALLQPQPRQPLLLTMTCSNGYFISPFLNGISERFVLEPDKGAIAAFSPSGLSLDEAAHLYHRALVQELVSRRHARLGDLVLAAQKDYADTGAFPELLSLYHLFGDPALQVR